MSEETLHLFVEQNDGDLYAARDAIHAVEMWCRDTGYAPDDADMRPIADETSVTINAEGVKATKSAGAWAMEAGAPGCIGGENY